MLTNITKRLQGLDVFSIFAAPVTEAVAPGYAPARPFASLGGPSSFFFFFFFFLVTVGPAVSPCAPLFLPPG